MRAFPFPNMLRSPSQLKPKPFPAREWAKIARGTGMRYMVMTTKHHEGFCHFDTKTTDYCSPKTRAGPRSRS